MLVLITGDERGKRERGYTCGMKECVRDNVCVWECVVCVFWWCMCVAEVPALWFKKERSGQMKFASNEAQIARPSILAVRYQYRIHGPRLLLEIAGTLVLFLAFQLHPPHSLISLVSSNNNNPPSLFYWFSLFLFSCHRFNYSTYFFFCGMSLVPNSQVSFLVYSMFSI